MIERADESGDPEPLLFRRHRGLITGFLRSEPVRSSWAARMMSYYMGWTDAMGEPQHVESCKLIRSALTLWACGACGGNLRDALAAACGIEWFHYATQAYDDADEVMRALAFTVSVQSYGGRNRSASVTCAINRAAIEQMETPRSELELEALVQVTPLRYFRMAAAQTGALLGACLEAAAIVADASPERTFIMRRAGRLLGTAFQICDDVRVMYGDSPSIGNSTSGDARRYKIAFPVIAGVRAMSPQQRESLAQILRVQDGDNEVRLRSLLDEVGAEALARKAALAYAAKSVDVIARAGLDQHAINEFKEVAHYIATRTR